MIENNINPSYSSLQLVASHEVEDAKCPTNVVPPPKTRPALQLLSWAPNWIQPWIGPSECSRSLPLPPRMARRPSAGSLALLTSPEFVRQNGFAVPPTPKRPSGQLTDATRRPSARSTSSSHKLDNIVNLAGTDPDGLFTRHTISEVKLAQQRLR